MAKSRILERGVRVVVVAAAGASLAACVTPRYATRDPGAGAPPPSGQGGYKVGKPYQVGGVWYVPREQPDYDRRGVASWYGDAFHLKTTANGEIFDMNAVTAAHTTLPLPSLVEVTNLDNGRKLTVRVNDRGPFVGDRIIDLSREAARQLGFERAGLANVRVRYLGPAPLLGPEAGVRVASAKPFPTRLPPPPAPVPPRAPAELAAATVKPPEPVSAEPLPPITGAAILDTPVAAPLATAPTRAAPPLVGPSPLKVQAGAFASEVNAQRAVARLGAAGDARIEPLERDGMVLYRVMLPAPADEAAAYALRDRVAAIGFEDARVVRTF